MCWGVLSNILYNGGARIRLSHPPTVLIVYESSSYYFNYLSKTIHPRHHKWVDIIGTEPRSQNTTKTYISFWNTRIMCSRTNYYYCSTLCVSLSFIFNRGFFLFMITFLFVVVSWGRCFSNYFQLEHHPNASRTTLYIQIFVICVIESVLYYFSYLAAR